jgi:hypothetical protein
MVAINPPPTDVNGALLKVAPLVAEVCVAVAPVVSPVRVTVVAPEPVPVPVPVLSADPECEVTDDVVVASLPPSPYSLA